MRNDLPVGSRAHKNDVQAPVRAVVPEKREYAECNTNYDVLRSALWDTEVSSTGHNDAVLAAEL